MVPGHTSKTDQKCKFQKIFILPDMLHGDVILVVRGGVQDKKNVFCQQVRVVPKVMSAVENFIKIYRDFKAISIFLKFSS